MPQPEHISALGVADPAGLDADLRAVWDKCVEKLGFVPNVYSAYSLKPRRLRNFIATYNEIMLSESGLSRLEREMIAVVVSSANRCYYCLVAHGAAVRMLSGDPELGEMMALNWRVAVLPARQRAMLEFAHKLTVASHEIAEADRAALRDLGFADADIFDIAETAAFFNLSNRMAAATDMMPNREYHRAGREAAAALVDGVAKKRGKKNQAKSRRRSGQPKR